MTIKFTCSVYMAFQFRVPNCMYKTIGLYNYNRSLQHLHKLNKIIKKQKHTLDFALCICLFLGLQEWSLKSWFYIFLYIFVSHCALTKVTFVIITTSEIINIKFPRGIELTITQKLLCVLAMHLHDNDIWGAWKHKLKKWNFLKTVLLSSTKMQICKNNDTMRMCTARSVYKNVYV